MFQINHNSMEREFRSLLYTNIKKTISKTISNNNNSETSKNLEKAHENSESY